MIDSTGKSSGEMCGSLQSALAHFVSATFVSENEAKEVGRATPLLGGLVIQPGTF
jgi:hypothetical protein